MASYPPPSQAVPIFNPSDYETGNTALTLTTADARYLQLKGGTETGLVNFNSGLSSKAGAVNSPSIYLDGDSTTGLYRSAANEVAITCSGTQRAKVSSSGLTITGSVSATGNINPSGGSSANPSLYFGPDTTNGFYRITNGVGFSSGGTQLITFNSLGINNATKTFTEQLAVGSGGNTIKLMQFGTSGFSISFTPGQLQGPYDITFPTAYSSTPTVATSLYNTGGDPSQHVSFQVVFISTTKFQVSFSNESSLNISANTYNIQWIAVN